MFQGEKESENLSLILFYWNYVFATNSRFLISVSLQTESKTKECANFKFVVKSSVK